MANRILVIGPPGRGKTESLKFLPPEETVIICPEKKELLFRGAAKNYKTVVVDGKLDIMKSNYIPLADIGTIIGLIKKIAQNRPEVRYIAVDTVTYAMVNSYRKNVDTKGYDKYNAFAFELMDLIQVSMTLRNDLFIILSSHYETRDRNDSKEIGMKIPAGRFTREKIEPEGMFTVTLWSDASVEEGKRVYYFATQTNGETPARSPQGMFPSVHIQNDMKYVCDCITAFANDEEPPEAKIVALDTETNKPVESF